METKGKIIQAAIKEFAANGLEGARVDQIAVRAGVNKAMIYYHFNSKENLYNAVINDYFTLITNSIQMEIETNPKIELFLNKIANVFSSTIGQQPDFASIIIRELAVGGSRVKDTMTTLLAKSGLTTRIKALLEKGIADGSFRNIDPKQAIISFVSMNIFYLIASQLVNAIWDIENEAEFKKHRPEAIVDLILYGLKARQNE
jgi:TetR/AcrR family transcriptional regulator